MAASWVHAELHAPQLTASSWGGSILSWRNYTSASIVAVDGQLVVLDQTPIFLLELSNDTVDRIFCPLLAMYRLSF